MLIAVIGENCSGKSTLARKIQSVLGGEIVAGKDYLRMAKSESEATVLFKEKLKNAIAGETLIYVITEADLIRLLPDEAVRILVYADLETIKARFRERMHGNLPAPVAQMLERKHGMFENGEYEYRFDGTSPDADRLCEELKARNNANPAKETP